MAINPLASLDPAEKSSLRRIGGGYPNFVPDSHKATLLSMGLIAFNEKGRAGLTAFGRDRLAADDGQRDNAPITFVPRRSIKDRQ